MGERGEKEGDVRKVKYKKEGRRRGWKVEGGEEGRTNE
jgi:hypothetical protein